MAITTEPVYQREFQLNKDFTRSYVFTYQSVTDDPFISEADVAADTGWDIGLEHPNDSDAKVSDIRSVTTTDDGCNWQTTVRFETLTDPLDLPAEITYQPSQFQRPTEVDCFGKAILNSARDRYYNLLERDQSRPVFTITKNFATDVYALSQFYSDAINIGPWNGAATATVKVASISDVLVNDEVFGAYHRATAVFHHEPLGWDRKVLDQGFRWRDGNNLKHLITKDNVPVSEPALLNGQGKILPPNGTPFFNEHKIYNRLPFGLFDLWLL